jgi:putative DNA methylase
MPRDGATISPKDKLAQEIAKAVGAGRPMSVETVDFSDPNRPKTCIEVDFPILAINQIAQIEGNAGKPIYQMSKWWARRRSSVFRAMLLASAMKAPEDPTHAAKVVWDAYYANHQRKGALSHLKVADVFMGGGTTLVEGSRLGMQMSGVDLNPVAWFVVRQEFAKPDLDAVKRLLADVEAEVRPQIMPFYACEGPGGEKGVWTRLVDTEVMDADFDPLMLTPDERKKYSYSGPEAIYTFWAKHGPCQVTGCGHRTPIMSSNVMAVKTLTVKRWAHACQACSRPFDIESEQALHGAGRAAGAIPGRARLRGAGQSWPGDLSALRAYGAGEAGRQGRTQEDRAFASGASFMASGRAEGRCKRTALRWFGPGRCREYGTLECDARRNHTTLGGAGPTT